MFCVNYLYRSPSRTRNHQLNTVLHISRESGFVVELFLFCRRHRRLSFLAPRSLFYYDIFTSNNLFTNKQYPTISLHIKEKKWIEVRKIKLTNTTQNIERKQTIKKNDVRSPQFTAVQIFTFFKLVKCALFSTHRPLWNVQKENQLANTHSSQFQWIEKIETKRKSLENTEEKSRRTNKRRGNSINIKFVDKHKQFFF